jgi:hypothetical protein
LIHTVNFATRIQNDSKTAINNIAATTNLIPLKQRKRKVNNETIMQFQLLLKSET